MINLNDLESIKKIDPQNTYASTDMLVQQLESAWNQVSNMNIMSDIGTLSDVAFCGMGASIYGGLVIKALFGNQVDFPMEIVTDYHLPNFVGNNSLVVLTSYSGSTEEIISCAKEAKEKTANMIVLTKGGPLAEFAKANVIPSYIFDGALNPSGVPRLGNGYTILGLIGILSICGVIKLNEIEIKKAIDFLKKKNPEAKAKAMQDAQAFISKTPIIFAAEHLAGNAQILRNQFNETSKTFSSYYLVPDLNHHLMEGLQFPQPSNLLFIVLNSSHYSERIQRRMQLTIDVIKQNKHQILEINTSGMTAFDDIFEVLSYGSYLTLFLALLYNQNPAVNPWVDYFKKQLSTPNK